MTKEFELKLIDQYWGDGSRVRYMGPGDCTSHGKILLKVNGRDISGCDQDNIDYGINQSTVALLKTVFVDHELWDITKRSTWPMIFHGCDLIGNCPNCFIDFRVHHKHDENVVLDRFFGRVGTHFDESGPGEILELDDESVILPNIEYAKMVYEFGKKAFDFLPIKKGNDYEIPIYNYIRYEIEVLVLLVEKYLKEKNISDDMRQRASVFDLCPKNIYSYETSSN